MYHVIVYFYLASGVVVPHSMPIAKIDKAHCAASAQELVTLLLAADGNRDGHVLPKITYECK